jgi:hypothetical protein
MVHLTLAELMQLSPTALSAHLRSCRIIEETTRGCVIRERPMQARQGVVRFRPHRVAAVLNLKEHGSEEAQQAATNGELEREH